MTAAPDISTAIPVVDADPFAPDVLADAERRFRLLSGVSIRLDAIKPFTFPGNWARLYEFRVYTMHNGLGDRFSGLMRDVLPVREKYSPNVGTWRTRSGHADRVIHVWAYRDLGERDGPHLASTQTPRGSSMSPTSRRSSRI